MNRSHSSHSSGRRDIIDLVPASGGGSLIARIFGLSFLILGFVIVVLAGVRIVGIVFFRSGIEEATGDIARVGGFDAHMTEWATGPFSFVVSLALFGIFLRLMAGFLLPGFAGRHWLRNSIIFAFFTGFFAFLPGLIMTGRGVAIDGMAAEMEEVDPAAMRWFDYDKTPLIFYADHLDGERRFWNRPGSTPFDASEARPVTPEVRMLWEQSENEREEEARERAAEEARLAEEAKREEMAKAEQEQTISELKQQVAALSAGSASSDASTVSWSTVDFGDREEEFTTPPVPAPVERKPDFQSLVRVGTPLQLTLFGRPAEIRVDGTVRIQVMGEGRELLVGPGRWHRFSGSTLVVSVSRGEAVQLSLRWESPEHEGLSPMVTKPSNAGGPRQISSAPSPRVAPTHPVQSFPLTRGRATWVDVRGDAVEFWTNGNALMGSDRAPHQAIPGGQRVQVEGRRKIHVAPGSGSATTLFIRKMAPGSASHSSTTLVRY